MMFARYDAQGRYTWFGTATLGTVLANTPGVYVGTVDLLTQYHDSKTNSPKGRGNPPSANHTFDYATKQWLDMRSLSALKEDKWTAIKQAREAVELGPFSYNGKLFDGDLDAQRRLAGYISLSKAAVAAGKPFSAVFTLYDNTAVSLTAQDFIGMELAKIQSVAKAFYYANTLRTSIDAASSKEQLNSIVWNP